MPIPDNVRAALVAAIDELLDVMLAEAIELRNYPMDGARLAVSRALRDLSTAQQKLDRGGSIEALAAALGAIEVAARTIQRQAHRYAPTATVGV